MVHVKQYNYPDTAQRKIVLFNNFCMYMILGYLFLNTIATLKTTFIYQPVLTYTLIIALVAHFIGNLAGSFLFSRFSRSRIVYIIFEVLFVLLAISSIMINFVSSAFIKLILYSFLASPVYLIALISLIPFITGIKNNYFLKISSGTFFDEKKGALMYIFTILTGSVCGILLFAAAHSNLIHPSIALAPIIFMLPTIFLIKLEYFPHPFYAQKYEEATDTSQKNDTIEFRDDLVFIYLNFTYIIMYILLTGYTAVKFFGDFIFIKFYFILIVCCSITIGYIISRLCKRAFWHIYSELTYPFLFFSFYLLLQELHSHINFLYALLFFIPAGIIFGFTLYHSINCIVSSFDQQKSFKILNYSIFIMPIPIIIALSTIPLTQRWFFILFYAIALLNIIFPGIHFVQRKIKEYKKGLYFFFAILSIPFFIVLHLYYDVPFSSELFLQHSSGFNNIYLPKKSTTVSPQNDFSLNNQKVIDLSYSNTWNFERSLLALSFFYKKGQETILFLDGYRKFFSLPMYKYFGSVKVLDYVPDYIIDYNRPAITGQNNIIYEEKDILLFLEENKDSFPLIIDVPNLYDQKNNSFRFSREYYKILKKRLHKEALYAQIINLSYCDPDFLHSALSALSKNFAKSICFLLGNHLLSVSSDAPDSLMLSNASISSFNTFMRLDPHFSELSYNPLQLLSYIISADLKTTQLDSSQQTRSNNDPALFPPIVRIHPDTDLLDSLILMDLEHHDNALALVDPKKNLRLFSDMKSFYARNGKILSLLKQAEQFEINAQYRKEIKLLFQLKNIAEYKDNDLRRYIKTLLDLKENIYFQIALELEKQKKWEKVDAIYKSILEINKNNFNANYRLGILSITLQDLDSAFSYLQTAMNLEKNNPEVMHQMGVLLFSSGKYQEALHYLNKALSSKKKQASTYFYIGLCYEELNQLPNAKEYYTQAHLIDPNDEDILSSLERLNEKIEKERNKWKLPPQKTQLEEEQGENIPLPINKRALDNRLKDKAEED